MSRLIDADELMGIAEETALVWEYRRIVSDIRNIIEKAPTINPDDLRTRGRWIVRQNMLDIEGMLGVRCSLCGRYWALPEKTPEEFKGEFRFCPNCGARMEDRDG